MESHLQDDCLSFSHPILFQGRKNEVRNMCDLFTLIKKTYFFLEMPLSSSRFLLARLYHVTTPRCLWCRQRRRGWRMLAELDNQQCSGPLPIYLLECLSFCYWFVIFFCIVTILTIFCVCHICLANIGFPASCLQFSFVSAHRRLIFLNS